MLATEYFRQNSVVGVELAVEALEAVARSHSAVIILKKYIVRYIDIYHQ